MDPSALIGPSTPLGYPAPYWFLALFKVLGFTLHAVPMSLWFAGIVFAMLMRWRGGTHAQHLSNRLMKQMPIVVALGINLGIVPLLFIQVAYYKVFYPATILMAWPWLSIVFLLIPAYYGVYLYAGGLKAEGTMTNLRRASGWVAMVLFIVVGFLFSNAFSLMTRLEAWPELWMGSSVAGAPLGTVMNLSDATLMPRWLMMFGLAVTTVGAYIAVDTGLLAKQEDPEYRQAAMKMAFNISTLGIVWFAAMGTWYVFGTWPEETRQHMLGGSTIILTLLTAAGPGLVWLLLLIQRTRVTATLALATGLVQFGVLGLNAISRQVVQNFELKPYLDVTTERVQTQLSPMLVFLVLFLAGLGVIIWMLRQAAIASREPVAG